MPATNYAVTIPSLNNAPNPSGTLQFPDQPGPNPDNLLVCTYTDTISGTAQVQLLWCPDQGFSLPDSEANDPNFGSVSFTYDPPLT